MIDKFEGRWRFLSNFYPCKIEHQGITYPSVENFYVAMKVNDQQLINGTYYTPGDFREMIAKISNPAEVLECVMLGGSIITSISYDRRPKSNFGTSRCNPNIFTDITIEQAMELVK